MTRARNIAGFSTITTIPSPIHVGPIGVLTATRIDGAFGVVDINPRHVNISGITTGLNVSGIITAQNGINFNGTSTGLNVSGVGTIATLNVSGNATIAGVLTYEDVTRVDSVGVVTARGLSIFGNTTGLQVASGISTFQAITATTATFSGTSTFNDTHVDIADSIRHIGDSDTKIRFPSADTFTVETGGSERLRISSLGQVLIGTTTEGSVGADELTIATSGSTGLTIRSGTSNDGNIFFSDTTSGTSEYAGYVQYEHANNALRFGTASTERLRITSGGDVIIGNSSAEDGAHFQHYQSSSRHQSFQSTNGDLAIVTDNSSNPALYIKGTGSADLVNVFDNTTEVFTIKDGGNVGIKSDNPSSELSITGDIDSSHSGLAVNIFESTNNHSRLRILSGDTSLAQLEFGDQSDVDAGEIRYDHDNERMTFHVGSNTERLRIGSDGQLLHSSTGALAVDFGTTNTGGAYHKYDLSANGATTGYIGAGNQLVSGGVVADFAFRSQGNMVFSTGGDTERVRITSGGHVSVVSNSFALGNPTNNVGMHTKVIGPGFLGPGSNVTIAMGIAYAGGRVIAHAYKTADATKQTTYYANFQARGTSNGNRSSEQLVTQNGGVNYSVGDAAQGFKITNNESFTITYSLMIEIVGNIPF